MRLQSVLTHPATPPLQPARRGRCFLQEQAQAALVQRGSLSTLRAGYEAAVFVLPPQGAGLFAFRTSVLCHAFVVGAGAGSCSSVRGSARCAPGDAFRISALLFACRLGLGRRTSAAPQSRLGAQLACSAGVPHKAGRVRTAVLQQAGFAGDGGPRPPFAAKSRPREARRACRLHPVDLCS